MDPTTQILLVFAALAVVMVLLIAIPVIVIPIQKKKKEKEGKNSLPQGSDSSDFSRFLREKYREDNYMKQAGDDDDFQ